MINLSTAVALAAILLIAPGDGVTLQRADEASTTPVVNSVAITPESSNYNPAPTYTDVDVQPDMETQIPGLADMRIHNPQGRDPLWELKQSR